MQEEWKTTNMNMRYPADVVAAIRQYAQADGRSFHNLVIWILRQYIQQRREQEGKKRRRYADLRVQIGWEASTIRED